VYATGENESGVFGSDHDAARLLEAPGRERAAAAIGTLASPTPVGGLSVAISWISIRGPSGMRMTP
jgi:hypothetical protein